MLRLGREPSIRAMGMSTMRRMLQGKTRYAAGNRRSRFFSIRVRKSQRRGQVYNAATGISPPKLVE